MAKTSDKRVLAMMSLARPGMTHRVEALLAELRRLTGHVEVADARLTAAIPPGAADIAVIFGGDGTFLAAARRLALSGIPVAGVNLGRLGFLTEFSEEEFRAMAGDILSGKLPTLPRMMLDVAICRGNQPCFESPAMNEVSIVAGEPFRMIELSVEHDGTPIFSFLGDGLVLATPTGSTAYTLSAGGPILEPDMQAIAVTPVAAHSLSARPIVVNADHGIAVTPLRVNPGTSASIDGQISCHVEAGDVIRVGRSPHSLSVVRNPQWPFFRKLSTKLQWGRSPHHREE